MSRIARVEERLAGLLRDDSWSEPKPLAWLVREWVFFAQQYIQAASVLDGASDTDNVAKLQLSGHAVECAFKAFLLVATRSASQTHDILALGKAAETAGCHVTEMQAIATLQLSLSYSRDIATNTRYKARYPTTDFESKVAATPDHDSVVQLVTSVLAQVEARQSSLRDDA